MQVRLIGRTGQKQTADRPHPTGKGISDQDRNILSNQLLILEFLRSVSGLLARGSQPTLAGQKKKGKAREEEDDSEVGNSDQDDGSRGQTSSPRGTVIITLRNVPPYTECKDFVSCSKSTLTA